MRDSPSRVSPGFETSGSGVEMEGAWMPSLICRLSSSSLSSNLLRSSRTLGASDVEDSIEGTSEAGVGAEGEFSATVSFLILARRALVLAMISGAEKDKVVVLSGGCA